MTEPVNSHGEEGKAVPSSPAEVSFVSFMMVSVSLGVSLILFVVDMAMWASPLNRALPVTFGMMSLVLFPPFVWVIRHKMGWLRAWWAPPASAIGVFFLGMTLAMSLQSMEPDRPAPKIERMSPVASDSGAHPAPIVPAPAHPKAKPTDPLDMAHDAYNHGRYDEALKNIADLPLERMRSPEVVAFRQKVMDAADTDTAASRAQDGIERLQTYWRPQIDQILTSQPDSIETLAIRNRDISRLAEALEDTDGMALNASQRAIRNSYRAALAARQARAFPGMRKGYAKLMDDRLWEKDIRAEAIGAGNRTIRFTGAVFASNAGIKMMEEAVRQQVASIRATRVQYCWYRGQDDCQFYRQDVPTDTAVGKLVAGEFVPVK